MNDTCFGHSSLKMPMAPASTPSNHAKTRPHPPSSWITAPRNRPPPSSTLQNTVPTEELILARLDGMKQGREQYEQGLKELQEKQGTDDQRPRANEEALQGRLMALESQMTELGAEVERRCGAANVPQNQSSWSLLPETLDPLLRTDGRVSEKEGLAPMLLTASEADTPMVDSSAAPGMSSSLQDAHGEQNSHLDPALNTNESTAVVPRLIRLVKLSEILIHRIKKRIAECQDGQAEQNVEILRLRQLNLTYVNSLKAEFVYLDELSVAVTEFQSKPRLKELDLDYGPNWLVRKAGLRRETILGSSIGPSIEARQGPSTTLPSGRNLTSPSERRNLVSSTSYVERERPSIESRGIEPDNDTAISESSRARGALPPHNKRKRDLMDAGDEADNFKITHQRKRTDLTDRRMPPPQRSMARGNMPLPSGQHPTRDLSSTWRTHDPRGYHFSDSPPTRADHLPCRDADTVEAKRPDLYSKHKDDGEAPATTFPLGNRSAGLRIPSNGPGLGKGKWEHSMLRKDH